MVYRSRVQNKSLEEAGLQRRETRIAVHSRGLVDTPSFDCSKKGLSFLSALEVLVRYRCRTRRIRRQEALDRRPLGHMHAETLLRETWRNPTIGWPRSL